MTKSLAPVQEPPISGAARPRDPAAVRASGRASSRSHRVLAPVLSLFLLVGLLSLSSDAWAQYRHKGLGATLGFIVPFQQAKVGASPGLLVGIEGFWRFEDRWMAVAETSFSFHFSCTADDQAVCKSGDTPILLSAVVSIRHLFTSDEFRPWVGLGFSFWQFIFAMSNTAFGPDLGVGFDWFAGEDISVGLKARYTLLLVLSKAAAKFDVRHAVWGGIEAQVYF